MIPQTPQLSNPRRAVVPPSGCCHPDHEGTRLVARHSTVWYRDADHGYPYEGPCCKKCYAAHILKHYPESRIAQHVRNFPREYRNRYARKRR